MVLRGLRLVVVLLFASLPAMSLAHAADGKWVTISGTVWIDENRDRIRQPSEPVLTGVEVHTGRSLMGLGGREVGLAYTTNERGEYAFRSYYRISSGKPLHFLYLNVRYNKPGAEPVYTGWHHPYTHSACRLLYILARETDRTVDIGVIGVRGEPPPKNWSITDGHFFTETSTRSCVTGFAVTNTDGIPFWDTWQRLGLENVGYPISHRYIWRGFVTQAFQKAVFQWQPGKGVFFVNIFDEMHDLGLDEELRFRFSTPRQLDPSFDYIHPVDDQRWVREEMVRRRLALLDANPVIKEKYFAAPDPLLQYGLPTSRVRDHGNNFAIRTQRAVFQQWKNDVPWAKAGEVTIANGGDIAKQVGRRCKWHKSGTRCTHLFFPGDALAIHDLEALMPQPAGFVGARLP